MRDLLGVGDVSSTRGLNVRQHPKTGFFVDGLRSVPVKDYSEIKSCMTQASRMRGCLRRGARALGLFLSARRLLTYSEPRAPRTEPLLQRG